MWHPFSNGCSHSHMSSVLSIVLMPNYPRALHFCVYNNNHKLFVLTLTYIENWYIFHVRKCFSFERPPRLLLSNDIGIFLILIRKAYILRLDWRIRLITIISHANRVENLFVTWIFNEWRSFQNWLESPAQRL